MSAVSARGAELFITRADAVTVDLTATGATKDKPSQLTFASTAGAANTDLVVLDAKATALESIDGLPWIVSGLTATDIDLLGSDTTGDAGTFLGGTDGVKVYPASSMERLCPQVQNGIAYQAGQATTVSVGTFCDPSAQLPGEAAGAGTLTIRGYTDIADPGYQELVRAELDGVPRYFKLRLPNNGWFVFGGTLNSMSAMEVDVQGATSFTAEVALSSKPRHLF